LWRESAGLSTRAFREKRPRDIFMRSRAKMRLNALPAAFYGALRRKLMSPLTLALYQPDIPQNAGAMLRLCACLDVDAALIEPAGFPTSDRNFRRAGMDYLDHVTLARHASFTAFESWRARLAAEGAPRRLVLLTTSAALPYTAFAYAPGDILMVGRESAGAPADVHAAADARVIVPMRAGLRSLNVALAAAMVLGEALRQIGAE
jgi:tRNA (cytidine/uridine-2'-O-)-methyltransferase